MGIQRGPRVFCEGCRRNIPTYHPASDENARLHYQKHYLDVSARRDWCMNSRERVPATADGGMRDELALAVAERSTFTFSAPGAAALLAQFDELRARNSQLENDIAWLIKDNERLRPVAAAARHYVGQDIPVGRYDYQRHALVTAVAGLGDL